MLRFDRVEFPSSLRCSPCRHLCDHCANHSSGRQPNSIAQCRTACIPSLSAARCHGCGTPIGPAHATAIQLHQHVSRHNAAHRVHQWCSFGMSIRVPPRMRAFGEHCCNLHTITQRHCKCSKTYGPHACLKRITQHDAWLHTDVMRMCQSSAALFRQLFLVLPDTICNVGVKFA